MHYLIDGYNFLFWQKDLLPYWGGSCLRTDRQHLIEKLIDRSKHAPFSCRLIFDAHHTPEGLILLRQTPLDILFTPEGMTADEFILECLWTPEAKKIYCVVTQDSGLRRKVIAEGVRVIDFATLYKRLDKKKHEHFQLKEEVSLSPTWVKRYSEIFEKRYQNLSEKKNSLY